MSNCKKSQTLGQKIDALLKEAHDKACAAYKEAQTKIEQFKANTQAEETKIDTAGTKDADKFEKNVSDAAAKVKAEAEKLAAEAKAEAQKLAAEAKAEAEKAKQALENAATAVKNWFEGKTEQK